MSIFRNSRPFPFLCAIAALTVFAADTTTAQGDTTPIVAKVLNTHDGDTVVLNNPLHTHIRLQGVDAPELGAVGGDEAREAMKAIVGDHTLTCRPDGSHSYERIVGSCFTEDGTDIGLELIREGYAFDCYRYSHGVYASYETEQAKRTLGRARYCHTPEVLK